MRAVYALGSTVAVGTATLQVCAQSLSASSSESPVRGPAEYMGSYGCISPGLAGNSNSDASRPFSLW
jgi:hypothetical protein